MIGSAQSGGVSASCCRDIAAALLALALLAGSGAMSAARAQIGSDRYSSIVVDAATGSVLSAVNADEPRYPASLTKMMTLYMVFEALRDRRLTLDQPVPVSFHAASMPPSKLGLAVGTRLSVEQAILGLVTKSANDAAAALGELLGGDEDRFAQMMTLRARALGMANSNFRNASGLPDQEQTSTARDLATLGRHLVQDFPVQYRYFSVPSFAFHGRFIPNHDHMLISYPGADGIKTGYIVASGHNLVTSALRGNVRLVGVVLGAASNPERDAHMAALLDAGFEHMDVPIAPRRDLPIAARLPTLMASAQAATLPLPPIGANRAGRSQPPRWSIQLGSFSTEAAARTAATAGRRSLDSGEARAEPVVIRHKTTWRAMVTGLSLAEAQSACASLIRHRAACLVLRPDQGQFASR